MKANAGTVNIVLIVMLLMTAFVPFVSGVSDATTKISESLQMTVKLEGPAIVGIGVDSDFVLRIKYAYPERIENYSFTATILDEDIEVGGRITPNNGTADDGVFDIKIAGTNKVGQMTVIINATARELDVEWYTIEEFEIDVVESVLISATLENKGIINVSNVSVSLWIDGELIDTKYFAINGNTSVNFNFNWTFSTLQEGRHIVTLIIDDPSGVVEFSEGNNVLVKYIYYSTSGNILRGIIAIGIMFVAFILIMTILQRPGARGKSGK
ncbi:MAG: hypothetical protein OEV21_05165 [Thermoplasmata archaeon]|nr:hypothetical protein [Thermoplasmata archaeon]